MTATKKGGVLEPYTLEIFGNQSKSPDQINLMTLHSSKGLEFQAVIMPGLEAGVFPSTYDRTKEQLEEATRLFYVGVTRAKELVYLLYGFKEISADHCDSGGNGEHGAIAARSVAGFESPREDGMFEELLKTFEECREPNWDGYGAQPVQEAAYYLTHQFLAALPPSTPAPSIGAEPDGHLTVEWYRSPERSLSVSISPDGDLHYAALLERKRICGTESFGARMPRVVADLIKRVEETQC